MIKPAGQSEWVNLIPNFNLDWKTPAIEILNYVSTRHPKNVCVLYLRVNSTRIGHPVPSLRNEGHLSAGGSEMRSETKPPRSGCAEARRRLRIISGTGEHFVRGVCSGRLIQFVPCVALGRNTVSRGFNVVPIIND